MRLFRRHTDQLDMHPKDCTCGLCEQVHRAGWVEFLATLIEICLWTIGIAAVLGFIFAQIAIK